MTVPRQLSALAALLALLLGTGCRDGDGAPMTAETDEPLYVQGIQLKKQNRHGEALTAFLKVIDRRGERGAAESHFEAGEIYLNHAKEPGEAYHYVRKYLELQPNSKQADLVRGRVETAKREFWRQVAGRPLDDQSVQLKVNEEVSKLRREIDELRAENAVLRGGGATPVNRPNRVLNLPIEPPRSTPITVPTATIADSPIRPAPATPASPVGTASSNPIRAAMGAETFPRPSSVTKQAPRPATPGGLTHTVKPKETPFAISRQYGVKVEDLMAANGIKNPSTIQPGTVLKIPAPATAR
jgi:LysM repeat protein